MYLVCIYLILEKVAFRFLESQIPVHNYHQHCHNWCQLNAVSVQRRLFCTQCRLYKQIQRIVSVISEVNIT